DHTKKSPVPNAPEHGPAFGRGCVFYSARSCSAVFSLLPFCRTSCQLVRVDERQQPGSLSLRIHGAWITSFPAQGFIPSPSDAPTLSRCRFLLLTLPAAIPADDSLSMKIVGTQIVISACIWSPPAWLISAPRK